MTTHLSPSQHAILAHASNNAKGQIDLIPDNIKGGARKKVIDAMFSRALIINDGTNWIVANEGYEALGMTRPVFEGHTGASHVLADEIGTEDPTDAEIDASNATDPEIEAALTAIENAAGAETKTPRTRDNSTQTTVIGMLKRPEGATIQQIMAVTGWLSHTVRGTFAGTFKQKLGPVLVPDKGEGDRVYRIAG